MSTWRIREIENEIEKLEKLRTGSGIGSKYDIQRKIDDLKSELRRLKRREEEEDDDGLIGSSPIFGSGSHSGGGFGGFGGGGFGGGGAGGSW